MKNVIAVILIIINLNIINNSSKFKQKDNIIMQ